MITGGCPYCDATVVNWMPEVTPKYGKSKCDACGKEYWMVYSRLQPMAYTVEDFEAKYIVDDVAKTVVERNPPPPLTPLQQEVVDRIAEAYAKEFEELFFSGADYPESKE